MLAEVRFAFCVATRRAGTAGVEALLGCGAIAVDRASRAVFAWFACTVAASGAASVGADLAFVASAVLGTRGTIFVVCAVSVATSLCADAADAGLATVASAVLGAGLAVFAALGLAEAVSTAFAVVGIFANTSKGLRFKLFAGAIGGALCVIFADALADASASSDTDPTLETRQTFGAAFKAKVFLVSLDADQSAIARQKGITDFADLSALGGRRRRRQADRKTGHDRGAGFVEGAGDIGSLGATSACLDGGEKGGLTAFVVDALGVLLAEAELVGADGAAGGAAAIGILVAAFHADRANARDLGALEAGGAKTLEARKPVATESDRAIGSTYPNASGFLIDAQAGHPKAARDLVGARFEGGVSIGALAKALEAGLGGGAVGVCGAGAKARIFGEADGGAILRAAAKTCGTPAFEAAFGAASDRGSVQDTGFVGRAVAALGAVAFAQAVLGAAWVFAGILEAEAVFAASSVVCARGGVARSSLWEAAFGPVALLAEVALGATIVWAARKDAAPTLPCFGAVSALAAVGGGVAGFTGLGRQSDKVVTTALEAGSARAAVFVLLAGLRGVERADGLLIIRWKRSEDRSVLSDGVIHRCVGIGAVAESQRMADLVLCYCRKIESVGVECRQYAPRDRWGGVKHDIGIEKRSARRLCGGVGKGEDFALKADQRPFTGCCKVQR